MSVSWSRRVVVAALTFSCSGAPALPVSQSLAPSADIVQPVLGIADRGNDPAVVAIDASGADVCAGALVASDVVITAAHCVMVTAAVTCPMVDGSTPVVRSTDEMGVTRQDASPFVGARVGVQSIFLSPTVTPCSADLAVLLLQRPIDGVEPLSIRTTGVAQGDHVRTVEYGVLAGAMSLPIEIVRDHVPVGATTRAQFLLDEAACQSGCGGPVIDESSGEIVGVLSRGSAGPSGFDVATRAEVFLALVAQALQQSTGANDSSGLKIKKGPIDMGAACVSGADCASGVCVTSGAQQYCSRLCEAHDRCPSDYRCEVTTGGAEVCVQT